MIDKLLGFIQVTWFLFIRRNAFFWIGFLGFIFSISLKIFRPEEVVYYQIFLFSSLGLEAIQIIGDLYRFFTIGKNFEFEKIDSSILEEISLPPEYAEFKKICFHRDIVIYNEQVNLMLADSKINFGQLLLKQKFNTDILLGGLSKLILKRDFFNVKTLFNSGKIRLVTDLLPNKDLNIIQLQPTDYFSNRITNSTTLLQIKEKCTGKIVYNGIDFCYKSRMLPLLKDSNCSNHIGITTLAISKDGFMILSVQGKTAESDEKMTASGSGSCDLKDCKRRVRGKRSRPSFKRMIVYSMNRELFEECGFQTWWEKLFDIINEKKVKTKIIGFGRLLLRGGKPEFFGLSLINITSDKIRRKGTEKRYGKSFQTVDIRNCDRNQFISVLKQEMEKRDIERSVSLYLNLKFLIDLLETHPGEFDLIQNHYTKSKRKKASSKVDEGFLQEAQA